MDENKPDPAEVRAVLTAIAQGYPVKGEHDRYIVVENPDYREERGDNPNLVIDVLAFASATEAPPVAGMGEGVIPAGWSDCENVGWCHLPGRCTRHDDLPAYTAKPTPPAGVSPSTPSLCEKCGRTISEHWDFPTVCDGFKLREKTPPACVSQSAPSATEVVGSGSGNGVTQPASVSGEVVTQADREAAAAFERAVGQLPTYCDAIQRGERDNGLVVQSFAAHRLATAPEAATPSAEQDLVGEWRERALKAAECLGEAKGLLSVLADTADVLNAHIDEVTYDDRRKLEDWPDDHEFDLAIPWHMISNLNAIICKAQRWMNGQAADKAPSAVGGVDRMRSLWARRRGVTVHSRDGWAAPSVRIQFNQLEDAHSFDEALRAALASGEPSPDRGRGE